MEREERTIKNAIGCTVRAKFTDEQLEEWYEAGWELVKEEAKASSHIQQLKRREST